MNLGRQLRSLKKTLINNISESDDHSQNFKLPTKRKPPTISEMINFEKDVIQIVKDIKFKKKQLQKIRNMKEELLIKEKFRHQIIMQIVL